VSKRVRVFEDGALKRALAANQLSVSAAEELVIVTNLEQRHQLLERAVEESWDRARMRAEVKALLEPADAGPDGGSDGAARPDDDIERDDAGRSGDLADNGDGEGSAGQRQERPADLAERISQLSQLLADGALHRRVVELDVLLGELRPWQLTQADDDALRELFHVLHGDSLHGAVESLNQTLRLLGRASREQRLQFPSLDDAEAAARVRRARR
jgi:hypothetical protein